MPQIFWQRDQMARLSKVALFLESQMN